VATYTGDQQFTAASLPLLYSECIKEQRLSKALILSLGGSTDPIVASIASHKPSFVVFYASHKSSANIGTIIDELKGRSVTFDHRVIIVTNENDLVECYEDALKSIEHVRDLGVEAKDVTVDYTGGTKNMTAALVLATVNKQFRFSYVGGTQRTKEGLGIAVSGNEVVLTSASPWQVMQVEEKRRLAVNFNAHQFRAAEEIARALSKNLPPPHNEVFVHLAEAVGGYHAWDLFKHNEARLLLSRAHGGLTNVLPFVSSDKGILKDFEEGMGRNLRFLDKMITGEKKNAQIPTFNHLSDLMANARRRGDEGRYDDGVARLYRALELVAQIELSTKYQINAGSVEPEQLPEILRDEYRRLYTNDHSGKIQLGLTASYRLLRELGSVIGTKFSENEKRLLDIQSNRNHSILAHGLAAVSKEVYEKLYAFLGELWDIKQSIEFPRLNWE